MAFFLPLLLPSVQIPFPDSPSCCSRVLHWHEEEERAGEAKIVQIKMEKGGLVDMENSGKSQAIPCQAEALWKSFIL